MDIEYPVLCPLMEEKISAGICFDIHMVVEGAAPIYTAPRKATDTDNFREICLNCPYHRDD